jgi:hypothetical protein
MAVALKSIASSPSAATLTTAYTCPAATTAVVGAINICNRSATPTTVRVARRLLGAAIADAHYLAYDLPLDANEVISIGGGTSLIATDIISVYATLATVSFNISLQENS